MKLCLKCFNENVYVFKYNTCPGCGKKFWKKYIIVKVMYILDFFIYF
jgi:hypothetical protein